MRRLALYGAAALQPATIDPVDFFWGCIWNNIRYAVRVVPMSQRFDAVGLSIAVTAAVLAGWWLVRLRR